MQRHDPHSVGVLLGFRASHSSLPGRDGFIRVKGKAADLGFGSNSLPRRSCVVAVVRGTAVGGILNDFQIVALGQGGDAGDVPDLPSIMDGDNRRDFFASREGGFDSPVDIRDVEVEVRRPAIDQQRRGAEIADHLSRGRKRHRWHHDRLAGLQSDRFECQMQRGGAGIDRDCVSVPYVAGKLRLKLFCLRTGRQPTGPQTIYHLIDFRLADTRLVKRDRVHKPPPTGKPSVLSRFYQHPEIMAAQEQQRGKPRV